MSPEVALLTTTRRTLRDEAALPSGARVLVACSGGPDSAALLHVLARLGPELTFEVAAATVHHGLRRDADRDVAVAGRLAETLGVPFRVLRVEVPAGASLQARAREVRYAALREEAERRGAVAIAVGHTLDDQAETVLARLLRGARVRGLVGIELRREDGVLRPFLRCRRTWVAAYVKAWGLPAVEDPSNRDPRFERSRLRHELLPRLEREDPAIWEHLAALAADAQDVVAVVDDRAEVLLGAARDAVGELRVEALREAPPAVLRAALARWVGSALGVPAVRGTHLAALERAVRQGRGEVRLGAGVTVCVRGARVGPSRPARDREKDPEEGR